MTIDRDLSNGLKSAIIQASDSLDSLADLGVVMIMLSSSSASGRSEWIEKQLESISVSGHQICLLITKFGDHELLKSLEMITESISSLVTSVAQAADESATFEKLEHARQQVVENWSKACSAISSLVLALNLKTAPWWREIEDRRPAYQLLINQLLVQYIPS